MTPSKNPSTVRSTVGSTPLPIKIPYKIHQVTPIPNKNAFIATVTKLVEVSLELEVVPEKILFAKIQTNRVYPENGALIRIDGHTGRIQWEMQLQHFGRFGVWNYDDSGNFAIVSYTKNNKGILSVCMSYISTKGVELARANLGPGVMYSLVYNNEKWYAFSVDDLIIMMASKY